MAGARLVGKVAVVTGAARGIGLALCRAFAKEGAAVVLGDVADDAGREAARGIEAAGGRARYVHCDVAEPRDAAALMDEAARAFGALDVAVANAGINRVGGVLDLSPEDWEAVLRVNLTGCFLVGQAAARRMVEQGTGGAIINIASTNAVLVQPGQAAYPVSKGGVVLLTRVMATELADHRIRVNAIGPGPTRTDLLAATLEKDPVMRRSIELRTPLRRPAEPEEIAAAAVFLASEDASYMTGQTLYVDGGRLVLNYTMPERG